jgi:IS30 family transposase
MRQSNYTQKAIALAIGKDKSVISRELKRNSDGRTGEYKSDLAERKCRERHKRKRKSSKFTAPMQDRVETLLREDYSPEQVVGFLKQEDTACVSHERIYQHIWADKKRGGNLYKHLRTKGKRYRKRGAAKDKRGTICNKVSIEERPDIVEEKSRFGDLEIDTVIGKNHQGAIVTINP